MIHVAPIGSIDSTILEHIGNLVSKRFRTGVKVAENLSVDVFRKNEARGQYLSRSILRVLSVRKESDEVLLGVADVDLYADSLNFVFGEADPTSRVAVISLTRLRQSFYGLQNNRGLLLKRAGKEAVHEIGHVLGLSHCIDPSCVMFFSNSLADTDRKGDDFCKRCWASLQKRLHS
ncbi:MAG: archaemetzincin [Candidatus Bathyarchaeia archaeon]